MTETKQDMLEIIIQRRIDRFGRIPERTNADKALLELLQLMFDYMKEL